MAEQQQQNQDVNPTEARTFLSNFGLPADKFQDAEVVQLFPTIKGNVDKFTSTAVETAIKERGEFGPNWRQALAGEDPEALKTLERFQDPKALYSSYGALRQKMSSGELKASTPFPDKGTDDDKAAWRKDQGIPDKPEGYEVKPPEGVVIGEADKPFLEGFKKYAHEKNMTPAALNTAVAWWGEERTRRAEAAAQQTAEAKKATEDQLRNEWGQEYRPHLNRIQGLLDAGAGGDADLKESILNSVAINPGFARFMADMAFKINPTSTLTSGDAGTQLGSIEDGIRKVEAVMRKDRKAYDKDTKMQADYLRYLDAYQRLAGKAWNTK